MEAEEEEEAEEDEDEDDEDEEDEEEEEEIGNVVPMTLCNAGVALTIEIFCDTVDGKSTSIYLAFDGKIFCWDFSLQ